MDEYRLSRVLDNSRSNTLSRDHENRGIRRDYYSAPFSLFLVFHYLNQGVMDIPTPMANSVLEELQRNSCPIGTVFKASLEYQSKNPYGRVTTYRGGESLFNNLAGNPNNRGQLNRMSDPAGNQYYANGSLILDKTLRPLMVPCKRITVPDLRRPGNFSQSTVLKISKLVYVNSSRILEKFILNKVIPINFLDLNFDQIEICEDLSHYVESPQKIRGGIDPNIQLNSCLVSNLSALVEDV